MFRYISVTLLFHFLLYNSFYGQTKHVNFGVQFSDTILLPHSGNQIISLNLKHLPKKHSRKYYYENPASLKNKFEDNSNTWVSLVGKKENKHHILVSPLEPNKSYMLEVKYTDRYNIYGLFRSVHEEGITFYKEDKEWMKIVQILNQNTVYKAYYHPTNIELDGMRQALNGYDLNSKFDTTGLRNLFFKKFEILKFREEKIENSTLISFGRWLKSTKLNADSGSEFVATFKIPDYLKIYRFYEEHLKEVMESEFYISHEKFMTIVDRALDEKIQCIVSARPLDAQMPIPNIYSVVFRGWTTYKTYVSLNTNPIDYETSYKRSLTPDFGYIVYDPFNQKITGGSPFIGVHIALSPVNKDIPLRLSKLPFQKRFSIHTGVTLNSIKKERFRDNFFSNYSLMLGGGYKLFTQSTRLNFGAVLFNKIDAVSGKKSFSTVPYLGISIDIEIRKWLSESIPTFSGLFKGK